MKAKRRHKKVVARMVLRTEFFVDGKPLPIKAWVVRLVLERLVMAKPGSLTSLQELIEHVYPDPDNSPQDEPHSIRCAIYDLREFGLQIEVESGKGYRLVMD